MNTDGRFDLALHFLATMAKRRNKKKQKFKKDKIRPRMPAPKPNDAHMPICSAVGCNRPVSDARKSRCGHCSSSSSWDEWDYYNIYD